MAESNEVKDNKRNESGSVQGDDSNYIEKAINTLELMKKENERLESNIKKLSELKAFEIIGGKSIGRNQEEKPKEITPKEYAEMLLSGKVNFS